MIRTDNLNLVVSQRKLNSASLARLLDCSDVYAGKLLAGKTSFGERAARSVEAKLSLPRGWLDEVHDGVEYSDDSLKEIQSLTNNVNHQMGATNSGVIQTGECLSEPPLHVSENRPFYFGLPGVTTSVRSPVVAWDRLGMDLYKGIEDFDLAVVEHRPYFTHKNTGGRCKFIRLESDALSPRLLPGDVVLVDPDNTAPKRDEICLLKTPDGEFALMRFRPTVGGFEAYDERGRVLDNVRHGLTIVATAVLFQRDNI